MVYSKVTLRRAATVAKTRRETWRLSPLAEWGSHRWRCRYDSGMWPLAQTFMMCFLWFAACRAPWLLPCKSGQNATKKRSGGHQGPAVTFSPFLLLLAKLYWPYMSVNSQIYCQIPCRLLTCWHHLQLVIKCLLCICKSHLNNSEAGCPARSAGADWLK